ncbi:MAG: hypothetical protein QME74_01395 [Candidatus Edwardsbacteria bacterium]|nr:hypothetical protein [Candidatus Edwardsbacteria bacterium]
MSHNNRLYFPRLILFGITLLVLALIFVSVVLIQEQAILIRAAGYALAALSALSFLPVSREWISPSYLELSGNAALIKWNNWQVSGNVGEIDFPAKKPKRLGISLTEAETRIDPVGPLFLLSSIVLYPILKPIVPAWWAPLYAINKKQLDGILGMASSKSLAVSFPAPVFGKRRMRRVIENAVV